MTTKTTSPDHSGALSHVRVLDLSRVLAGPWAGQILADLGAKVIKVERPGAGDDTRHWGPPFVKDEDGKDTADAAYFMAANRGKKSVTIDFTRPEGQALIRGLVKGCDILLENFKVGGLAKYGLDYASLKEVNPELIYCSVTGFGQDGPYSHRAGYDFIVQAIGGLMSITGERDDLPGGGPQKVGVAVADLMSGMYAVTSILAALSHRQAGGGGQYIDIALLDTQVAMAANMNMNYLVSGKVPGRMGNAHANIVPYQVLPCRDGELVLAAGNDGQFRRFCEVAGCPGMAADERFATNAARVRNRDTLIPLLEEILRRRDGQDWMDALDAAGVPCGPINALDQVFRDPQVIHRGMRVDLPHAAAGTVPLVASPIKMSGTPVAYADAPPTLGQHTSGVLEGLLGLSEPDLQALRDAGVI